MQESTVEQRRRVTAQEWGWDVRGSLDKFFDFAVPHTNSIVASIENRG
jgi:hypothetical protein